MSIDVSAVVQTKINAGGDKLITFCVAPANTGTPGSGQTFVAREDPNTAQRPQLTVVYTGTPPIGLSSLSLSQYSVCGGVTNPSGTVTLTGNAPTGGVPITLSSNNAGVKLSAPGVQANQSISLTIPVGSASAGFTVNTTAVSSTTNVTISAGDNIGTQLTQTLTVNPPGLSTFTLNLNRVAGGNSAVGTVTLSGPAPAGGFQVNLSKSGSGSSAISIPASVTVPVGASTSTFTITTATVTDSVTATITASNASTSLQQSLEIDPFMVNALTLTPNPVSGATPVTGMVTLNGPAPTNTTVALTNSPVCPAIAFSASLTISAGQTSATFPVTITPVTQQTFAQMSAVIANSTATPASATLELDPLCVTGLSVAPNPITGGLTPYPVGSVLLSGQAPAGGTTVYLGSDNAAASVPNSVNVSAGQTSTSFTVTTTSVNPALTANIGASTIGTFSSPSQAQYATPLSLTPPKVSGLTLPTSIVSGSSAQGTVTLNVSAPTGGMPVTLSSNNASVLLSAPGVPTPAQSITPTVTGGSSLTFTLSTTVVSAQATVTITASTPTSTQSQSFTLLPLVVNGLSFTPNPVIGGDPTIGSLTLNGPAPACGVTVALTSDNPNAVLPTPPSVQVPGGSYTSASFTVNTNLVSAQSLANIKATYNGASLSTALTINPLLVSSVTVIPSPVAGGVQVTGTVALNGTAPVGGIVVLVACGTGGNFTPSPYALLQLPQFGTMNGVFYSQLAIPYGASSANFTINTTLPSTSISMGIMTLYNGQNMLTSFTILPFGISSMSLVPGSIGNGQVASGTVTFNAPAPGPYTLTLSNGGCAAAQLSATSVNIQAGTSSYPFTVTGAQVNNDMTTSITASCNGTSASAPLTITAPKTYTVTATAGANGAVVPATQTVNSGTSVTLVATPNAGYTVDTWSGNGTANGNSYTLTNVTANQTVTVTFKLLQYTVTASVGGDGTGGTISPTTQTVNSGGSATVTATPGTGYMVNTWTGNGTANGNVFTLTNITANQAVCVTFKKTICTVTASVGGDGTGGTVSPATQTVNSGGSATVTATSNAGFTVNTWSGNGTANGNSYTLTNVTVDQAVSVTFKKIQYTVTASVGGDGTGGTVSPATQQVNSGDSATVTANPATGYKVDSWAGNGAADPNNINNYTLASVTSNQTVTVTFNKITFTVSASVGGDGTGGTVSPTTQQVNYGDSATVTATPGAGYVVNSWTGNGTANGNIFTLTNITANQAVSVTFNKTICTVTASVGGDGTGGTVSPAMQTVNFHGSAMVTAYPGTGYKVNSWSGNGTANGNTFMLINVTTDQAVIVTFKKITFTVSASVVGGSMGGTVSPATQQVNYGDAATVTATPSAGYIVNTWSGNGTPSADNNSYTITNITADQSVTVNFAPVTVSFNPASLTVPVGSTASMSATVTPSSATGQVTFDTPGPTSPGQQQNPQLATVSGSAAHLTVSGLLTGSTSVRAWLNNASGSTQLASAPVTVVGVKGMEYRIGTGSINPVIGTVYVPFGVLVTFFVLPDPLAYTWKASDPLIWSGAQPIQGQPGTASATFLTDGSVTVSFGTSSVTATVKVVTLTIPSPIYVGQNMSANVNVTMNPPNAPVQIGIDDENTAYSEWDSGDALLTVFGVSAGTTHLTATLPDGTALGSPTEVDVVSVSFDQNPVNVLVGHTVQINATIIPANTSITFQIPTVIAPNPTIATMNTLTATTFTISGVTPGSTCVQALLNGNMIASLPIVVPGVNIPSAGITSPANNTLFCWNRDQVPVTITASDPDGSNALQSLTGNVAGPQPTTISALSPYTAATIFLGNYPAGSYTVSASATDYLGQTGTATPVNFSIQIPPAIAVTSPADGTLFPSLPATIALTAFATTAQVNTTIVSVNFYVDGIFVATGVVDGSGTSYNASTTITSVGGHLITAVATDTNGWSTTSIPITISVRSRSPLVILLTPTDKQVFYPKNGATGADIPVSATTTGMDGLVVDLQLGITSGGQIVSSSDSSGTNITSYAYTSPNVPISAQPYTAYAVAKDSNGAFSVTGLPGTEAAFNVTPGAVITSPINYTIENNIQYQPGNNIYVNSIILPNNITTVILHAFDGKNDNIISSIDNPGSSTTLPFNNLQQGDYALTVIAIDTAGTKYYSAPVNIRVNLKPTVQAWVSSNLFKAPSATNVVGPITIRTITTCSNTIQKVVFFKNINGETVQIGECDSSPFQSSLTPNCPIGSYTIGAQAYDNLNGVSDISWVTFRVDGTPSVTITCPTNNSMYSQGNMVTISAYAQDPDPSDGSIYGMQIYVVNSNGIVTPLGHINCNGGVSASISSTWSTAVFGNYGTYATAVNSVGMIGGSNLIAFAVSPAPPTPLPANAGFVDTDHWMESELGIYGPAIAAVMPVIKNYIESSYGAGTFSTLHIVFTRHNIWGEKQSNIDRCKSLLETICKVNEIIMDEDGGGAIVNITNWGLQANDAWEKINTWIDVESANGE